MQKRTKTQSGIAKKCGSNSKKTKVSLFLVDHFKKESESLGLPLGLGVSGERLAVKTRGFSAKSPHGKPTEFYDAQIQDAEVKLYESYDETMTSEISFGGVSVRFFRIIGKDAIRYFACLKRGNRIEPESEEEKSKEHWYNPKFRMPIAEMVSFPGNFELLASAGSEEELLPMVCKKLEMEEKRLLSEGSAIARIREEVEGNFGRSELESALAADRLKEIMNGNQVIPAKAESSEFDFVSQVKPSKEMESMLFDENYEKEIKKEESPDGNDSAVSIVLNPVVEKEINFGEDGGEADMPLSERMMNLSKKLEKTNKDASFRMRELSKTMKSVERLDKKKKAKEKKDSSRQ